MAEDRRDIRRERLLTDPYGVISRGPSRTSLDTGPWDKDRGFQLHFSHYKVPVLFEK